MKGQEGDPGRGENCVGPAGRAGAVNPSRTQSQYSEGPTSDPSQALGPKNQPGRLLKTQVAGPYPEFLILLF